MLIIDPFAILKKNSVLMLLFSIFSTTYAADNIAINITGTVIASPCTIDNNGTYNVDLGQKISAATLATSGSHSEWKNFQITLSNCPSGTTSVTASFSGNPSSDDSTMYSNISGDGYARRIAIQLQDIDGTNVSNGKSLTKIVASDKTVRFPLQARVSSTNGGATPGNISSQVLFSVTYN